MSRFRSDNSLFHNFPSLVYSSSSSYHPIIYRLVSIVALLSTLSLLNLFFSMVLEVYGSWYHFYSSIFIIKYSLSLLFNIEPLQILILGPFFLSTFAFRFLFCFYILVLRVGWGNSGEFLTFFSLLVWFNSQKETLHIIPVWTLSYKEQYSFLVNVLFFMGGKCFSENCRIHRNFPKFCIHIHCHWWKLTVAWANHLYWAKLVKVAGALWRKISCIDIEN